MRTPKISPLICNTITGNWANENGGGIICRDFSNLTVVNTILWDNFALSGPEIWIGAEPSTLTISFSNVEGGQNSVYIDPRSMLNWGPDMIDSNPLFVDPGNDDFHITFMSPCRGSGDDSTPGISMEDFEGDPRIFQGAVDIGADEFFPHLYFSGSITPGIPSDTGTVTPGSPIDIRVIGLPGITPITLGMNDMIQDPPQSTPYGDIYLLQPLMDQWNLNTVPSNGVRNVSVTAPTTWQSGNQFFFQALLGEKGWPYSDITNLMTMTVE